MSADKLRAATLLDYLEQGGTLQHPKLGEIGQVESGDLATSAHRMHGVVQGEKVWLTLEAELKFLYTLVEFLNTPEQKAQRISIFAANALHRTL